MWTLRAVALSGSRAPRPSAGAFRQFLIELPQSSVPGGFVLEALERYRWPVRRLYMGVGPLLVEATA